MNQGNKHGKEKLRKESGPAQSSSRGLLITREVLILENIHFPGKEEILLPRVQRARYIAIDATVLGGPVSKHLAKRLGECKLEAVTFTNERKRELFSRAKKAFQGKQLRIPSDSKLRDDLASIHRIVTPQGLVKFIAARTSDGHADRATALALATDAASRVVDTIFNGGRINSRDQEQIRSRLLRRPRYRQAWVG